MRHRNIQFKPTAGVLIPLLLACFAAMFISASTPALANDHDEDQPFSGTVSGTIPEDLGPPVPGTDGCVFSFTVPNSGNSNQLGQFTGTANFVPNLCDGSYTGTFQWVAQNGGRDLRTFPGATDPDGNAGRLLEHGNLDRHRRHRSLPARHRHVHSVWSSGLQHEDLCPPMARDDLFGPPLGRIDCAPDLRIATSVRLVAVREIDEEPALFSSRATPKIHQ